MYFQEDPRKKKFCFVSTVDIIFSPACIFWNPDVEVVKKIYRFLKNIICRSGSHYGKTNLVILIRSNQFSSLWLKPTLFAAHFQDI